MRSSVPGGNPNPWTDDPLSPWVELAPARWFTVEDLRHHSEHAQIREVIAHDRRKHGTRYYGFGFVLNVKGQPSTRQAGGVPILDEWMPREIAAELDRRRAILEKFHTQRRSAHV